MKKILTITLVLVLLAVTVVPALAAGGPPAGKGPGAGKSAGRIGVSTFALAGTIASIDPTAHTVTVAVVSGNKQAKQYIGQNLTLLTTVSTRFLLRNPDSVATPITFADLSVGQKVSVNGQLTDNVWVATRITVGARLICLP